MFRPCLRAFAHLCSILILACGDGADSADAEGSAGSETSGGVDDGSASAPASSSDSPDDDASDDAVDTSGDASTEGESGGSDDDTGTSGGTTTIDVGGVVTNFFGRPVADAEVTIAGTTAVTDDDGAFAIADVTPPYDAMVVLDDGGVTVLLGLTREDPSLHTYGGFTDPRSADIDGEFSGGAGFPNPPGHTFAVSFDGFDTHTESWSYSIGNGPDYHLHPQWYGPAAQEGTVMALQYQQVVNGQPLGYDALGVMDLVVSDSGEFANQDLALMPVADSIVGGTLTTPDDVTFAEVRLFVGTGELASVFVGWQDDPLDSYEFLTPQGQGAYASVSYVTGRNDAYVFAFRTDIAPGTMDADLDVPTLPEWNSPPNGATDFGVDTPLAWTPIADAVSVVTVTCEGADVGVRIVTAESTAAIPDLSAMGVQFPALATCWVQVDQYAPFSSVDEWSGPESPMRNRSRVDSSYPSTALVDGAFAELGDLAFTASP